MRKILLVTFCVICACVGLNVCQAAEVKADSRITSVVVYPDSALITRVASVKLTPGEHDIVFADIVPHIDENSLRVSAKGTAAATLFGAQLKREQLEDVPDKQIVALRDEIQWLKDKLTHLADEQQVLAQERSFLGSIRLFAADQIPKDLVTKMPTAQQLNDTIAFTKQALSDNLQKKLNFEQEDRNLRKQLDVAQRRLNELTAHQRSQRLQRSIAVAAEVSKAGTLDVSVSYLVSGAAWYMIYDARVDSKKKEVELVSYGIVRQATGEDWSDVSVTLSTVKPSIGGRMPYIRPWFLRVYELANSRTSFKREVSDQIGANFEAMAPQREGVSRGRAGQYQTFEEEDKAELGFAETAQKGTAIVYELARKETIASDNTEHRIPVTSQMLKGDFSYSACPQVSAFAYYGCRVTNSKDTQLLAGRVNVFLEGDYIGNSSIDNVGSGESFDLYLGVDEGVKVARKELERKIDKTLFAGISSPNKKTILRYRIKVENYKPETITLHLFEPTPTSQDDRIGVKIDKVSLKPSVQDWKDRKGVWKWDLELKPQEKKEIFFDYIIEHPRDLNIQGLS